MQAVVWKLLLQISKNIVMVSLLPFNIFIEVLLLCGDELLFFFFLQNWRIGYWLGLMLHHRDESCLQWQNVLKYCHRYAFMQGAHKKHLAHILQLSSWTDYWRSM